jgi:hypothetical protein
MGLLLAAILVLVMALAFHGPFLALLALKAIVLPDMKDSPAIRTRRVLLEAARDIGRGGDPREITGRLEGVEVPEGRPRSYRDVAVRCLEMAGRHRRLEGRLRGEAAGWLKRASREMK